MTKRVIVHVANKLIKVVPTTVNAGAGETLIGTIEHDSVGDEDAVGFKPSHVLYHDVQLLMIAAKLFDYPSYKIWENVPVSGVNLKPAAVTVTVAAGANHTAQLVPTVLPEDTTDLKTVTYVSSDPTKATVNAEGLVTGVAVGSTNITATTTVGAKTDVTVVTVTA